MSNMLSEAVDYGAAYDRVKGLHQGEVARLRDGLAIKRAATEDGRDVFRVGRPRMYGDRGELDFGGGEHRSSEDAVRAAFEASARSTDPESLGGAQRYSRWMPLSHGGRDVRLRGIGLDGQPLVASLDAGLDTKGSPVSWAALTPVRPSVMEAADSLAKASTPEPFSRSKTSNWVARGGGLPAYIQHIAHDLVEKRGKSESQAIQMAIGIVKRWARGGGKVDANTRAAAAKAVAEWERLKARAKSQEQMAESEAFWLPPIGEAWSEASRAAALTRRKVLHPDWDWGGTGAPSTPSHRTSYKNDVEFHRRGSGKATMSAVQKIAPQSVGTSDASHAEAMKSHLDVKGIPAAPFAEAMEKIAGHAGNSKSVRDVAARHAQAARTLASPSGTEKSSSDKVDVKPHYKQLSDIRMVGGKLPEGFTSRVTKAKPDTYDLRRVEKPQEVRGPDGQLLGYVGKVQYAGERVMSGKIQVGRSGGGMRWKAFDEKGKALRGSVHFNKNRFDALRDLGRYHPRHGAG